MIAKTSFAGTTRVAAAITCASSGFPPTSCNTLGSCDFSRVPLPAAIMAIAISQKSCSVLQNLGPTIQWLHSYVTQDKIYCVYIAPNEEMVREHAKQGGFPANRVSEVKLTIDPTSAEA